VIAYRKSRTLTGLWLFGGGDKSIPTDRCVAILKQLKAEGKDFTFVVFPGAGHGQSTRFQPRPRRQEPSSVGSRTPRRHCRRVERLVQSCLELPLLDPQTLAKS
jgi:dienelactone hydrolase